VVSHGGIAPDYAVVMEGGMGPRVCCGHNGVVWLEVTVHGHAAHGSQPQHGINALEHMSGLVVALENYKRTLANRAFRSPEGITMIPTLNIGGVFSSGPGGKINTVPALARFSLDRRVLANETVPAVERELRTFLREAARAIPRCRISIEKVAENASCYREPTHPFLAAMASCVRGVRKAPTTFSVSTGFNDMYFFAQRLKIPTVGYGPQGLALHGVDERARVRDLLNSAKIYARLLTTFEG
jgi:succinyl-diaminopimelate desuccinylase